MATHPKKPFDLSKIPSEPLFTILAAKVPDFGFEVSKNYLLVTVKVSAECRASESGKTKKQSKVRKSENSQIF